MKMTKTQFKESVKAVVRECLNERVIKEVAPPGKKSERMVQHVKASLKKSHPKWNDEKIASVAIATAWKAHNKGSEQDECGSVEESEVQGGNIPKSILDDIVRGIIKLVPSVKDNPDKIAKIAALFFHRKYGEVADGEALMSAIERNIEGDDDDNFKNEPVAKTDEDPTKDPDPAEQEEKSPASQEEEEEEEEEESVDENAQYKHVSDNQLDTAEEDKSRTIQTDPEVNENANTLPPNKGQYKTVAPHQYTTTDQNKSLTIQSDPRVNEIDVPGEEEVTAIEFGAKTTPDPLSIDGGEGEPNDHDYNEHEEILLVKVIGKAAERLEAMHGATNGMYDQEPEIPIKKSFPTKPLDGDSETDENPDSDDKSEKSNDDKKRK